MTKTGRIAPRHIPVHGDGGRLDGEEFDMISQGKGRADGTYRLHSSASWPYLPPESAAFRSGVEWSVSGGQPDEYRYTQKRDGAGANRGNCPSPARCHSGYR